MDIEKEIKKIREHFSNISEEELEEKLIKAGLCEIKSVGESNMRLVNLK